MDKQDTNHTQSHEQPLPIYSVIIPTRNEEEHLPGCLSNLQYAIQNAGITAEIIVVLNRCTDRTEEIARQAGCRLVREDAKNLSKIRNAGAREARGRILVTVDADSRVCAHLFEHLQTIMENPQIHGGGVLILPERWSLGILLTMLCLVPVALWYGISAGLFFARREAFFSIGGFNEAMVSVEDIDFARRLKAYARSQKGSFANVYRAWIITSCRKFDAFGDWYFIKNLPKVLRLFQGRDQVLANQVWYDFPRKPSD